MELLNKTDIRWSELFYFIRKRLWIILVAFVACAIAGFLVGKFLLVPEYTATTRMYVLNREAGGEVAYEDLVIGSQLQKDYDILITGENVTLEVIAHLGLDTTPAELAGKITVTAPENTRVLEIAIVDSDPEQAALIANTVREVASVQLVEIMDIDAVNLIHVATPPANPSSPSPVIYLIIGGLLGMFVSVNVLALCYFLADTIRNEDDVEFYLELSTLAVIPSCPELSFNPVKKHKT